MASVRDVVLLGLVVWIPATTGINSESFLTILDDLANKGLGVGNFQKYLDTSVTYTAKPLERSQLVSGLASSLEATFQDRIEAVRKLRDTIRAEYGKYGTSPNAPQCCTAPVGQLKDPRFHTQVNKETLCVGGQIRGTQRYPNAALLQTMKNNIRDVPNIKWQYFGSEEGLLFNYPTFHLCDGEYDPRFRPWYVESATQHPKDVVLVIDTSGSMSNKHAGKTLMSLAIEAGKTVIDTLNPNDRLGVVSFSGAPRRPSSSISTCYGQTLARATPENKEQLRSFVSSLSASGTTIYTSALQAAFNYFHNAETLAGERDQVILFLTDGLARDNNINTIYSTIRTNNAKLNNRVVIMTFGMGELDNIAFVILDRMAKQSDADPAAGDIKAGKLIRVSDPGNLRFDMATYYDFFSDLEAVDKVTFSVPYFDAFGLGLITSACLPIHVTEGGVQKLKGVICVDITLGDLLSQVSFFSQGELSYAFIMDENQRMLVHPLLPQPYDVKADPIFLNLQDLEQSPEIATVKASIVAGQSGYLAFSSARVRSLGDVTKDGVDEQSVPSHYYWQIVGTTGFSVCVVVADTDKQVDVQWDQALPTTFTYHRVDIQRAASMCSHFQREVVNGSSAVKFAPEAFEEPFAYIDGPETTATIDSYTNFITGKTDSNPGFKLGVRDAVAMTSHFDTVFTDNDASHYAVWRYLGTKEGVFRLLPGTFLSKTYDHKARPWYKRAVGQRGSITLSRPYVDAFGAGIVITLSKALFEGRIDSQHTTDDITAGVMGMDFTMAHLYELILEGYPTCSERSHSCFVMDNSGYVLLHDSFIGVSVCDSSKVEAIHVAEHSPCIAQVLYDKGHVSVEKCVDFEAIKERHFWRVKNQDLSTSSFTLTAIPNSNVFLVEQLTSSFCNKCYCKNKLCRPVAQGCECTCTKQAAYDYCNDHYTQKTRESIPCAPMPPPDDPFTTLEEEPVDISKRVELKECFDATYECRSKSTELSCNKFALCTWCKYSKTRSTLTEPYCTTKSRCFNGYEGATYTNKPCDGDSGSTSVANIMAPSLFILLLVAFLLWLQ